MASGLSRLRLGLLNLKRPQLNRLVQVLTRYCNLQRHKKTAGRAESSLCPKFSLEDETPKHHVGNSKLYQDNRVNYFGITKPAVQNVVTKCNINKLATYLKEAVKLFEFDLLPNKTTTAEQLHLQWAQKRPMQCVGGLYLTVADSLVSLLITNNNKKIFQSISNCEKEKRV